MPPLYDIYGLSHNRDVETIEKFLDHYCVRDKEEKRTEEEIQVWGNSRYGIEEILIPIATLSEVINYGVNNPDHGFVFYISNHLKGDIKSIILKFTYDKKIIFGVSIEEKIYISGNLIENKENAIKVLNQIVHLTSSYKSSIQFEYPPSDDEDEFDESIKMWSNLFTS